MIGARQIAFGKAAGAKGITAADYVQDGLVAMWDGIENVGYGKHDSESTEWVDLVRGNVGFTIPDGKKCSFTNSALRFDNTDGDAKALGVSCLPIIEEQDITIEVVYGSELCPGLDASTAVQYGTIIALANYRYRMLFRPTDMRTTAYISGIMEVDLLNPLPSPPKTMAITQTATSHYVYRDGEQIRFSSTAHQLSLSAANMILFGSSTGVGNQWAAGTILDISAIRIYNRDLTAEEIAHNCKIDKARFNLS